MWAYARANSRHNSCVLLTLKKLHIFFKNHCFRVYKRVGYKPFWTFINVQISIPFCRFGKIHRFTLPYHKFSKTRIKNKICEHNFFLFFDVFWKRSKTAQKSQKRDCKFRNILATGRNKNLHRKSEQNAHTMYAAGFYKMFATLLRLPKSATNPDNNFARFAP